MGSPYIHNVRTYFSFTKREFFELFITAVVASFILSFRKWGASFVDITTGLTNFALGVIFIVVALGVHLVAQKLMAIQLGYSMEFFWWKLGFFISLFIAFLTNGAFPLFFPGSVNGREITNLRVGIYMPRFKNWEFALANLAGPVANLFIIFLTQPFFFWSGLELFRFFIVVNIFIMLWSMLPVPLFHGIRVIEDGRTAYDWKGGTVGFQVFLGTRFWYVFVYSLMIVYSLLILLANIFAFWLSVVVALALVGLFYFMIEQSK